MEDSVSLNSYFIVLLQTFMVTSNTADIMRWWIKLNVKPQQEYPTFVNLKATEMVKQIAQVRREFALHTKNANSRAKNPNTGPFLVKQIGKARRVHTLREEGNNVQGGREKRDAETMPQKRSVATERSHKRHNKCPYLGTINRHLLDFDFEKVCSITLSNKHVYACLVCGRYFEGRGKNTYAYTHALEERHYVFINLHDCKVYCLPENYRVEDASLNDIVLFLKPSYTPQYVANIDTKIVYGKALDGTDFIPGCIGLNNLKNTDYFNVIIQVICSIATIRNYLLLLDTERIQPPDSVITTLVELIRKIYNTKNFKGIVSPHEFLQAVGVASKGVYKIGVQNDPVTLLSWIINRVHCRLKNKRTEESVISKALGGQLKVSTLDGQTWKESFLPFKILTLDVPSAPIFKDAQEKNVIPQVSIFQLLQKYNGQSEHTSEKGNICRYRLWKLPEYLLINIKRFTRNNFFLEKNPTIVSFPMKNLEMGTYVDENSPDINNLDTRYDLLCSVCHQGSPASGSYKIHVLHAPSGDWYEMEDLRVTSVLPQFVAQTENHYTHEFNFKMAFTKDDEDQIMFDLYDGLDTFAQQTNDRATEQDEPLSAAILNDSNSIPLKREGRCLNQYKEVATERAGDHADVDIGDPYDDDGLVFLVEDDENEDVAATERFPKAARSLGRRKTGGWVTKFQKKERVIYIGAPNSDAQAMASTHPNKGCFCIVSGIPWWMDVHELNRIMEDMGGTVAFSKILSDPANGASLGTAVVEFVDCNGCSTFRTAKTQFTAIQMADDIFNVIQASPLYREGIFKRGMLERIAAHLGLSLRKSAAEGVTSDLYHEIEFEVQQQEMIRNGAFQVSCRAFPWFNLNLLKFIGRAQRMERRNPESKHNIANHLDAYKHKQETTGDRYIMTMPPPAQLPTKNTGELVTLHSPRVIKVSNQQCAQKENKRSSNRESEDRKHRHTDKTRSSSTSRKDRVGETSKRGWSPNYREKRRHASSRTTDRNSTHHRDEKRRR
ncbi:U4/U6.U5 tri-snRNP-associated protein 2 [Babesia sp. Xinjiang]|uniref:U4/U6.U5 tri-snRNP-associated protein 2 n=1 Tax=Babesia sp. Xinjiang TaxID=462227 RepID=UPI000A2212D1|nr:U4/U6.U5 tri-snRNP-associated protein 2 [Babesia sp. Xinjiang]ORM41688.1 U4/U6.U5 tri-snRNP-associated protein 2 [Babesia sp. Xinjiang]